MRMELKRSIPLFHWESHINNINTFIKNIIKNTNVLFFHLLFSSFRAPYFLDFLFWAMPDSQLNTLMVICFKLSIIHLFSIYTFSWWSSFLLIV